MIRILARLSLFIALGVCGCATTASSYMEEFGIIKPELRLASGSLHVEMAGIHYIVNMSWIREGTDPPPCPCRPVHSIRRGDWSISFDAAESTAPAAGEWLAAHGPDLERQFERMIDALQVAYPEGGARRFRIIVLPPGSRFDGSWPQWAVSERKLRMTFAGPLPGPSQREDESLLYVMSFLSHEYAHSYFWFHPERFRNNFSGEVVAYTTQECVQAAASGSPYGELDGAWADFSKKVAGLSPGDLYARYRDRYPDTYLALFVASSELRKEAARVGGAPDAMRRYCAALPTSGRDFTRDPAAR